MNMKLTRNFIGVFAILFIQTSCLDWFFGGPRYPINEGQNPLLMETTQNNILHPSTTAGACNREPLYNGHHVSVIHSDCCP